MSLNKNRGFTLVELMLAMAFVSALLVAVAMTVIQIGNMYNRGITYKSVNQAGGALASELQRGINGSSPFDISTNGSGEGAHYVTKSWGGRLCLGQYSYIWNYGAAIASADLAHMNIYSAPDSSKPIGFIKVLDPSSSYCANPYSTITYSGAVELLDASESGLAIHSFSIDSDPTTLYDSGTDQRLYNISFLIGTNDQKALTDNYGAKECKTLSEINSDTAYCAVNQFDIVARSGNTAG